MLSEKKKAKLHKKLKNEGGLCLHIISLIRVYTPELDKEIRRLLAVEKKRYPAERINQWFVERLDEFWRAKVNFHLDAAWVLIRNRKIDEGEKSELQGMLEEISRLIDFAVDEFKHVDCYPKAERFFDDRNLRLYLQSIKSVLKDPLLPDEARCIDDAYAADALEFKEERIIFSGMIEEKVSVIPNLPKLDEDDLMGQMMRDSGFLEAWPVGRIIIDGWNLPVCKSESGEYFVDIEKMLAEFGGCPRGLVYESKEFYNCVGYNAHLKTCHDCSLHSYCPGDGHIEDRSIGMLAKKLRVAWEYRGDVCQAIPSLKKCLVWKK